MANVKKKVSQHDLRLLMSIQKRKAVTAPKKIESPLAKYPFTQNNVTRVLSCIVCDSVVKSEAVWSVHINSRQHKLNIAKSKPTFAPPPAPVPLKRPLVEPVLENPVPQKKIKGILKNAPPLPPSFFDNNVTTAAPKAKNPENGATELPKESSASVEEPMETDEKDVPVSTELPEGFFDNPVLDAKARNVEYKDPIQEEWERFQKEIKEETTVSAQIIHDDTEDATAQRQIEEIDEQLRKLSKVVELDHKREKVKACVMEKPKQIKEEVSSDDDDDFDIEFDWRAKRYLC
ncbi:Zinc finger protein 830 [Nesidiocoris tenuis]|uniref:Zinc finger protein 830 n=1 Tax=Nesidiocoris tenuis TaxID=355587 RepID=A0ABN7B9P2_9HEMI|nr:Zinc finger protein 830 [Nesidiocoris tenuis]